MNLKDNFLGDSGVAKLVPAILQCRSIVYLDLASNGLTSKCAKSLYQLLSNNETIVTVDLSTSASSAHPNRLGKESFLSLARVFEKSKALI